MKAVAFGYRCQECGQGTVRETVMPNYETKVRGYPFVVDSARIGVCDRCGAKHFAARETKRWEQLFEEERQKLVLGPEEIESLRKDLNLSMEQFAFLIGCTRQSLHTWGSSDRAAPQSRMADLLMKLVRASHQRGSIDVISFLVEQARELGVKLEVRTSEGDAQPLELHAKRVSQSTATHLRLIELAAETEPEREVVTLTKDDDDSVGVLDYDFGTASLRLNLLGDLAYDRFNVEIHFTDGQVERAQDVPVRDRRMCLLSGTRRREGDVTSVWLYPISGQGSAEAGK